MTRIIIDYQQSLASILTGSQICSPVPRRTKKGKKKKKAKNYGKCCIINKFSEQFITSEALNATIESQKEKLNRDEEREGNNPSFGNEEDFAAVSTDGISGEKKSRKG